jgi:hypothetical protein
VSSTAVARLKPAAVSFSGLLGSELLEVADARMRFHPLALAPILPRLGVWFEVAELDMRDSARAPGSAYPTKLHDEDIPRDAACRDRAVGSDDCSGLLILARNESLDCAGKAIAPAEPLRIWVVSAGYEDAITLFEGRSFGHR